MHQLGSHPQRSFDLCLKHNQGTLDYCRLTKIRKLLMITKKSSTLKQKCYNIGHSLTHSLIHSLTHSLTRRRSCIGRFCAASDEKMRDETLNIVITSRCRRREVSKTTMIMMTMTTTTVRLLTHYLTHLLTHLPGDDAGPADKDYEKGQWLRSVLNFGT